MKISIQNLIPELYKINHFLHADFPGVVRVIPNKILSLHTTRSWDFLQVKQGIAAGVLSRGQSGRGTIIGIIDTG